MRSCELSRRPRTPGCCSSWRAKASNAMRSRALAEELGVRLLLTGDVDWERIVELYAAADVFALLGPRAVLLDQQDRDAGRAQRRDDREDVAHDERRQAEARLVEHQQAGLPISARPIASICRSPPESVPASCAAALARGAGTARRPRRAFALSLRPRRTCRRRRAAGCPPPTLAEQLALLRHERRCRASPAPRGEAGRSSRRRSARAARRQHAHQRVEQGRLAGAVRADDGDDLARRRRSVMPRSTSAWP